jgi:predicted DNA-binding protein
MKTAISMPDETYRRVTQRARELGLSRSEFLSRAAVAYLDVVDNRSLILEINSALHTVGVDGDDSGEFAVAAGRRLIAADDEEW